MSGIGVDRIMRRAGHEHIQTTMGYVKQAEDLGGPLGAPFAPLPESLGTPAPAGIENELSKPPDPSTRKPRRSIGGVSAFRSDAPNDSGTLRRRARDSNPWEACTST